ncbi:hypothetical protein FRC0434_00140 [Corynebacterium diphtheriae]|nr:hypothetical protein FRC0434_00140 [Corynebacterium diphtheriae]CAB0924456.1 hypothetical protein FRC0435_00140 [Corynebacterium diphtheriae]
MKVRQSKVGGRARWALILSVVLTWFSVIGMCMAIIGAGRIIDGGGVSRWIIVGPFVVMVSFALRGWVLAGGQVAEERRVRRQLVERVFQAGEIRASKLPTGGCGGVGDGVRGEDGGFSCGVYVANSGVIDVAVVGFGGDGVVVSVVAGGGCGCYVADCSACGGWVS